MLLMLQVALVAPEAKIVDSFLSMFSALNGMIISFIIRLVPEEPLSESLLEPSAEALELMPESLEVFPISFIGPTRISSLMMERLLLIVSLKDILLFII